mgnify:CR=1 FL=1|jgi:hypothetical protein
MSVNPSTLEKMHRIETIYRQGFQSDLIDRTVDKLIDLEEARATRDLAELQQRLIAFEQTYQLASEEFYARYEAGQLEDSADFMEWSAFYDMHRSAQQYLAWLRGDA